jgi:membrane protease YdiL (CAAX protease family)
MPDERSRAGPERDDAGDPHRSSSRGGATAPGAPELTRERAATAPRLAPLLVTCLISFAAWELARLALARAPEGWAPPAVWSLVRALLLLAPAVLVTRRVFDEGPVHGLWLGPPARKGLLPSCLIGVGFVLATQALNVALSNPLVIPRPDAATLALTLFDAAVEEALFRGFLLSHLMHGRRFARANLLAAAIFLLRTRAG